MSAPDNPPTQPLTPAQSEQTATPVMPAPAVTSELRYAAPPQAQPQTPAPATAPAYPAQNTAPAYQTQQQGYPAQPQYSAPPQYGPGQQQVIYYPAYATPAAKTNTLALISLITGLIAFPLYMFWIGAPLSIASLITGYIALPQIKRTGESGRGLAMAGIIISWSLLGIFMLFGMGLLVLVLFFDNAYPPYLY